MPIDLSLYPKNWNQIANSIKNSANWTCEWCNKPCRPPGVSQKDTEQWLKDNHPEWLPHLYKIVEDYEQGIIKIAKPQRFTLTTAHLDHNPANCEADNLRALCSVCHLKLDRDDWNRTQKVRRMKLWEKHGQLTLDFGSIGGT
ncbi:MAG: hypothetical protein F6K22_02520 [Okeania sp. SIO2F4]|uniref:hypothetical protein n=1 Tax=Okeania sp. SIO2F4 TaxID=2607790 RepID=UPI00142AE37E|nr:hypothetical protein [Okeania sp. SIO2F4]NES01797.1 hypothetical protein [Okeania sp. SIO2F4]